MGGVHTTVKTKRSPWGLFFKTKSLLSDQRGLVVTVTIQFLKQPTKEFDKCNVETLRCGSCLTMSSIIAFCDTHRHFTISRFVKCFARAWPIFSDSCTTKHRFIRLIIIFYQRNLFVMMHSSEWVESRRLCHHTHTSNLNVKTKNWIPHSLL